MTSENKDRTRETYYRKLFGSHAVKPRASVEEVVSRAEEGIKVSLDDYLIMRDVQLIGSDGRVFESHPVVYVAKDVIRDEDGQFKWANVYSAINHLENEIEVPPGYISALPTMALNCALLIHAFKNGVEKHEDGTYITKNAAWQAVLDQFGDCDLGFGWQACATIIDGATNRIIDNPRDADFSNEYIYVGGNINTGRDQRVHTFSRDGLEDKELSKIDRNSNLYIFFQDFTGQSDLAVFDEIAKYSNWKFDRNIKSKLWVPDDSYCSASVGSNAINFNVEANGDTLGRSAFRGVLLEKDAGS